MGSDAYGQRTLEFVSNVSAATSHEEICNLVVQELRWYGLDFLTSWTLPAIGTESMERVDVNTRPLAYVEHYVRENLVYKDPVVSAMRLSLATLSWSDVRANTRLTRSERIIIDEARDFGATDGLTIPVISNSGCIGVFSPCGYKPDLSGRARAALELVGLYAQQALQRADVRARRAPTHAPLTPREREVMRWVAIGKTNDEIGSILGIQGSTVKTILGRAQQKLNAASRTYAVVQALRLGELDLNF